jgi:uncharacterized membrane protein YadS
MGVTRRPPSTVAGAMVHSAAPSVLHLAPLVAANDVAFAVIFGIFIVALLVLIVIVISWAVRRDRQGRAAWSQRRTGGATNADGETPPTPGR